MSKYLDGNGLLYLWGKIKALVSDKVNRVEGMGLSTNDYTNAEKEKLNGVATGANAYTHPAYPAVSAGLYKVTVDVQGHVTEAAAVTKSDITALGIPSQDTTYQAASGSAPGLMSAVDKRKLDAFSEASAYATLSALNSAVTGLYKYKGSVPTAANLPAFGNATGDVYDVRADGQNYAWNGTAWDALGAALVIDPITNAEIDALVAS